MIVSNLGYCWRWREWRTWSRPPRIRRPAPSDAAQTGGSYQNRQKLLPHAKEIYLKSYVGHSVADPDPYVFGPSGSGSVSRKCRSGSGSGSCHHQAKIVRKTLISTVLWLFYYLLSMKNDLKVSVFRIWIRMFLGLPDPNPDPQH